MAELTAPFVFKNEDKRIVYGPVLVPDEPDSDDDTVTAEHIENVAHKFVEEYGNIDVMHSLNNVGRLVESYIAPTDLEVDENNVVPKGSWVMGVRVTDDDAWKSVKSGKLGGFSIMAMQKTAMKSSKKDNKSKRVTLADLGNDWIVNAVSLVHEPAVPKAKWIAIKSKGNDDIDIKNNIDSNTSTKAIEGSLEHRKQMVDKKLEEVFASYERSPLIYSTMNDSVVFRIFDEANNTRKLYQVDYQIHDDGNVTFTSEPKEVRIEENVVDMGNMLGGFKSKTPSEENNSHSEGFMSKFIKTIGLGSKTSEKAGKTISNANFKKLQQAKEVIEDLLSVGEKERETKSSKGSEKSMEKDEVQSMIDDSLKSFDNKLDDVLNAMKGAVIEDDTGDKQEGEQSKDDDTDTGETEPSTKGKDDDGEDAYKEKYESVLKELEKAKKVPFSNRISGQDGGSKKSTGEVKSDRNAFGFKK